MAVANITVDVHSLEENVVYRVYVNNTLMTERTFVWPTTVNYIQEHMIIDGPAGQYSVYVTPVSACKLKNVTVNGKPSSDTFIIH